MSQWFLVTMDDGFVDTPVMIFVPISVLDGLEQRQYSKVT